ncbi:rod shape-determining protein RodA [Patescibacteria group bacterium]
MNINTKSLGIIVPAIILTIFSLTSIGSISPQLIQQQAIYIGLGLVAFALFSLMDYHIYGFFTWSWYAASIILLLATFIFGDSTRGSIRWIDLGFFRFQPSEFVKPLLIIFLSVYMARSKTHLKNYFNLLFASIFPLLLIFLQPDLGTAIILGVIILSQLFISKFPKKYIFLTLLPIMLISPVVFSFLKPYQVQRLQTFIDPKKDPLGSGYNSIQSVIAVGSGKLVGKGLGHGTQSQLNFLPERHTDFIFAAIAEEFGFVGAIVVILAYLWMLKTILEISENTKDKTSRLLCVGVFTALSIQVFVNIGMNMGILPITGITLPLVSVGGSSIISTAMLLGIVVNASKVYVLPKASLEIK